MAALTRELRNAAMRCRHGIDTNPARLLDLVALGTVADVVHARPQQPHAGRAGTAAHPSPAAASRDCANCSRPPGRTLAGVTGQDLGFQAGPRLNAAGRLDDMTRGIRCLLDRRSGAARALALDLARLNTDRKELEAKMQLEALVAGRRARRLARGARAGRGLSFMTRAGTRA